MGGYVRFTGDYAQLKGLGYEFQKLHAANYMSWNKNGVFIFKKGADVTHGEIDLYNLLSFLDTNPEVRETDDRIIFFKQEIEEGIAHSSNFYFLPYDAAHRKAYCASQRAWASYTDGMEKPPYISTQSVTHELLAQLNELRERGWLELVEVNE